MRFTRRENIAHQEEGQERIDALAEQMLGLLAGQTLETAQRVLYALTWALDNAQERAAKRTALKVEDCEFEDAAG